MALQHVCVDELSIPYNILREELSLVGVHLLNIEKLRHVGLNLWFGRDSKD